MLPAGDRAYLYKLRKEECVHLLKDLDLPPEGSVAMMRVKLISVAKTDLTPEQIEIFQAAKTQFHKARSEDTENMFIKTWIYNIPEEECREMLTEFNIEVTESEEQNRSI